MALVEVAQEWVAVVFGFGFAIGAGMLVGIVTNATARQWGMKPDSPTASHDPVPAQLIGVVERTLYVAVSAEPLLIIGWLLIKIGPQWNRWTHGAEVKGKGNIPGRSLFNLYLVGNGLSVLYGLVGYRLIGWIESGSTANVIVIPAALLVGTLVLEWGASKVAPPVRRSRQISAHNIAHRRVRRSGNRP